MLAFKRIFFTLFITFAAMFLFIFLIRLANNKSGFMGFQDLFSYFEKIDLYKPLHRFKEDFDKLRIQFDNLARSININNIFGSSGSGGRGVDSSWWDNFTKSVSSIFSWIGTNTANLFKLMYAIIFMPINLVVDLVQFIVDYLSIFTDFISYIISFDGYTSPIS